MSKSPVFVAGECAHVTSHLLINTNNSRHNESDSVKENTHPPCIFRFPTTTADFIHECDEWTGMGKISAFAHGRDGKMVRQRWWAASTWHKAIYWHTQRVPHSNASHSIHRQYRFFSALCAHAPRCEKSSTCFVRHDGRHICVLAFDEGGYQTMWKSNFFTRICRNGGENQSISVRLIRINSPLILNISKYQGETYAIK